MDSFLSFFDSNEFAVEEDGSDNRRPTLPPEPQTGNVEYKLKIINPSKQRFEHLVTQMKWRLREGHGEAFYEIGVEDNGALKGLCRGEMEDSKATLKRMAVALGASTTIIRERMLANGNFVAEIAVRKIPDDQNNIDVRIAVLGSAEAGKSTLIGVLTQGTMDNGHGSARLNMFRHLHEVQTGRTSSISQEILGFSNNGAVINYGSHELMTAEEICIRSTKIVTFLDPPGHRKYIRTTISGLSAYFPHYAMLVISCSSGVTNMTHEHLNMILALEVPFFVVISKIDASVDVDPVPSVEALLKAVGVRRVPIVINTYDDMITVGAKGLTSNVVPIFKLSCVSGEGIQKLMRFLHLLPPSCPENQKTRLEEEDAEFHIDEIFQVTEVGQVFGGLLKRGFLAKDMLMQVGPFDDGSFSSGVVASIHRNKTPCKVVHAGQTAAVHLAHLKGNIRRGMAIIPIDSDDDCGCLYFQAKLQVLFHRSAIYPGFQTTVYIGSIRQTARVEGLMAANGLNINEVSSVLFRFVSHPEYVRVGDRILFKEGNSRGTGTVTQVFPIFYRVKDELNVPNDVIFNENVNFNGEINKNDMIRANGFHGNVNGEINKFDIACANGFHGNVNGEVNKYENACANGFQGNVNSETNKYDIACANGFHRNVNGEINKYVNVSANGFHGKVNDEVNKQDFACINGFPGNINGEINKYNNTSVNGIHGNVNGQINNYDNASPNGFHGNIKGEINKYNNASTNGFHGHVNGEVNKHDFTCTNDFHGSVNDEINKCNNASVNGFQNVNGEINKLDNACANGFHGNVNSEINKHGITFANGVHGKVNTAKIKETDNSIHTGNYVQQNFPFATIVNGKMTFDNKKISLENAKYTAEVKRKILLNNASKNNLPDDIKRLEDPKKLDIGKENISFENDTNTVESSKKSQNDNNINKKSSNDLKKFVKNTKSKTNLTFGNFLNNLKIPESSVNASKKNNKIKINWPVSLADEDSGANRQSEVVENSNDKIKKVNIDTTKRPVVSNKDEDNNVVHASKKYNNIKINWPVSLADEANSANRQSEVVENSNDKVKKFNTDTTKRSVVSNKNEDNNTVNASKKYKNIKINWPVSLADEASGANRQSEGVENNNDIDKNFNTDTTKRFIVSNKNKENNIQHNVNDKELEQISHQMSTLGARPKQFHNNYRGDMCSKPFYHTRTFKPRKNTS